MAAKQVLKLSSVTTAFGVTLNCLANWRKRESDPLPVIKRGHFVFISPSELKVWAKKAGKQIIYYDYLTETLDLPAPITGPKLNKPKYVHKVLTAAEKRRKKRVH